MNPSDREDRGRCTVTELPANVRLEAGSLVTGAYLPGDHPFKRLSSRRDPALVVGARSVMDGVYFNLGEDGFVAIGEDCRFEGALLICDLELRIGDRVVLGWHTTLADADFHPIDPAQRMQDAVAISPLGLGQVRRPFERAPIVIEDDVWVGPNATILKGVRIGAGAFVEPGAVVVHDVPAGARVLGNPARIVGER